MNTETIPRIRGGWGFGPRLAKHGLSLEVDCASWPGSGKDLHDMPHVSLRIGHTQKAVLLRFAVQEVEVRSVNTKTQEPVWQDSCVEFFFSPVETKIANKTVVPPGYYNLECNAIGTILYYFGPDRHQRQPATKTVSKKIRTFPSLPRKPFETRSDIDIWYVDISVPVSALFQHPEWAAKLKTGLSGLEISANFYKCGDKLPRPHYISWKKIESKTPDFHRPEFFGRLRFE